MTDETKDELLERSRAAREAGDREEARELYGHAIDAHNDDPEVVSDYAIFLAEMDNAYEQADGMLDHARELAPEHPAVWAATAICRFEEGCSSAAFHAAQRGLEFAPDDQKLDRLAEQLAGAEPYTVPGTSHLLTWTADTPRGELELTIDFDRDVLLRDDLTPPFDEEHEADRVLVKSKKRAVEGDVRGAITCLEEAIESDVTDSRLPWRLGKLYFSRADHQSAARWLTEAADRYDTVLKREISLRRRYNALRMALQNWVAAGEIEKAEDLMFHEYRAEPMSEKKALVELRAGEFKAARRDYSRSIAEEATAGKHLRRAVCHLALGAPDDVASDLEKASELLDELGSAQRRAVDELIDRLEDRI